MKIGTITFHGAYNYGSMLQAYALQQAIESKGVDCKIINFRTFAQKRMYKVITGRKRIGQILKDISHIPFYHKLKRKNKLFEEFLSNNLVKTEKEYNSLKQLESDNLDFDVVVCGSDQIWKFGIEDFNYAYLLPWTKAKKISYAASYGPLTPFDESATEKFQKYLNDFSAISVREEGTKQLIERISHRNDIRIVCDPVFLLSKEQWMKLISPIPIIKHDYVFFYSLYADKEMIDIAKKVSEKYQLPIVISNFSTLFDLTSGFKMKLDCGPIEFLNLINHAKYVCTSSFHGAALSLILNKQLISLKGMNDSRISFILTQCGLQHCSINSTNEINNLSSVLIDDYNTVNKNISHYSESGWNFINEFILGNGEGL